MTGTWLDKLDWHPGKWRSPEGKEIPYRKASVGPHYQTGTTLCELGQIDVAVILTEWPANYTLDVINYLTLGSEFIPQEACSELNMARIFKVRRRDILKQSKTWWEQQRQAVWKAISAFETNAGFGPYEKDWRSMEDDAIPQWIHEEAEVETPMGPAHQPEKSKVLAREFRRDFPELFRGNLGLLNRPEPLELRQFYGRSYDDGFDEFEMGEF